MTSSMDSSASTTDHNHDDQSLSSTYFHRVLNEWKSATAASFREEAEQFSLPRTTGRHDMDSMSSELCSSLHGNGLSDTGNAHHPSQRRLEILLEHAGLHRTTAAASLDASGKPHHKKQLPLELTRCRPMNRSDFMARLKTFSSRTWFGKPVVANAIRCARYGWINIGTDELHCTSCKAHVFLKNTTKARDEVFHEEETEFRKQITKGHKKYCPWTDNPSPSCFGQLRPTPGPLIVNNAVLRAERIRSFICRQASRKQGPPKIIGIHRGMLTLLGEVRCFFQKEKSRNASFYSCCECILQNFQRNCVPPGESCLNALVDTIRQIQDEELTSLDELTFIIIFVRRLNTKGLQEWNEFFDKLSNTMKHYHQSVETEMGECELSMSDLQTGRTVDDLLTEECVPEILSLFGWDMVDLQVACHHRHALVCHWCQETRHIRDIVASTRSPRNKSSKYLQAASRALSACNSASTARKPASGKNTNSSDRESSASTEDLPSFHPILEHRACCPWVTRRGVNPITTADDFQASVGMKSKDDSSLLNSFEDIEEATLGALKAISNAAMGFTDLERLVRNTDEKNINANTSNISEEQQLILSDIDEDDERPSMKVYRKLCEPGFKRHESYNSVIPRKRRRDSRSLLHSRDGDSQIQAVRGFSKTSVWVHGWLAYVLAFRESIHQGIV